jgi:hypothetical protein
MQKCSLNQAALGQVALLWSLRRRQAEATFAYCCQPKAASRSFGLGVLGALIRHSGERIEVVLNVTSASIVFTRPVHLSSIQKVLLCIFMSVVR